MVVSKQNMIGQNVPRNYLDQRDSREAHKIGYIRGVPHKIFATVRQNCDSRHKLFGTVGQNCNSLLPTKFSKLSVLWKTSNLKMVIFLQR